MVQSAAGTELVKAEGAATIIELLPEETAKCQSMRMVDQGFWCIGHPEAMTKPPFAEFSVLRSCTWEGQIETAYPMETIFG